jgi:hypothetical protein
VVKPTIIAAVVPLTTAAAPQPPPAAPVHQTQKVRPTLSMDFIGKQLARHVRQKPSEIPAVQVGRHAVVGQEIVAESQRRQGT